MFKRYNHAIFVDLTKVDRDTKNIKQLVLLTY